MSACSYGTDMVVVNMSNQPIEIRYKIRSQTGPFRLPAQPAMKKVSQLKDNHQWRTLSPSEYTLSPENRTITVGLPPNCGLRIEGLHRGGMQVDEEEDAKYFGIEEINLKGASGEIILKGKQVRKSFLAESKQVFTLTYR